MPKAILTWTKSTGANSYDVSKTGSGVIASTTQLHHDDTGLDHGSTQEYEVNAINAVGSTPSNDVTVVIVPDAPVLDGSKASSTEIDLSWSVPSGATEFILKRDGSTIYAGSSTSFSDTGLSSGSSHSYVVIATNAGGNSDNSNTKSFVLVPDAPVLTSVDAGSGTISSSWTSSSGATEYELSLDSGSGYVVVYNGPLLTFDDTSLADGDYSLHVIARNTGGDSDLSNQEDITLGGGGGLLDAPVLSGSLSTPSPSNFLSWSGPDSGPPLYNNLCDGYILKRDGSTIYTGPDTFFTDTAVAFGTAYVYQVTGTISGIVATNDSNTIMLVPVWYFASTRGVAGDDSGTDWAAFWDQDGNYLGASPDPYPTIGVLLQESGYSAHTSGGITYLLEFPGGGTPDYDMRAADGHIVSLLSTTPEFSGRIGHGTMSVDPYTSSASCSVGYENDIDGDGDWHLVVRHLDYSATASSPGTCFHLISSDDTVLQTLFVANGFSSSLTTARDIYIVSSAQSFNGTEYFPHHFYIGIAGMDTIVEFTADVTGTVAVIRAVTLNFSAAPSQTKRMVRPAYA